MARWRRSVILKWYDRWLRLLAMLLPRPDLHCAGPMALGDFRNIFLPNIGEDQKKSHHPSVGLLAGTAHIMVNPALVIALRA